jgi:hypothetical protein
MTNILFTCAGGKFTYDTIMGLKSIDKKIKVIGVDTNPNIEKSFFDNFELVPRADVIEKKYINKIFNIVKKHKIKIVLVNSENESLAVSNNSKLFEKNKILTSVGDFETVNLMTDKFQMMNFLNQNGLDTGKFKKISNLEEADQEIFKFGYPKKKIILKQRYGSGSRGIFVINGNINRCKELLTDRICLEGNWNIIRDQIKLRLGSLDNFLLMPYYEGDTFDVDCVANRGKLVNISIRKRVYENPFSPVNEGCKLIESSKIYKYCENIIKIMNIHKACDFDITLDKKKKPKILDASSRLSGSVGASIIGGKNILIDLLKIIQSKKIRIKKVNKKKELRVLPVTKFIKL